MTEISLHFLCAHLRQPFFLKAREVRQMRASAGDPVGPDIGNLTPSVVEGLGHDIPELANRTVAARDARERNAARARAVDAGALQGIH